MMSIVAVSHVNILHCEHHHHHHHHHQGQVMIVMTHIEAPRLGELVIVGGGVEAGAVLVALVSLNMTDMCECRTYQFAE